MNKSNLPKNKTGNLHGSKTADSNPKRPVLPKPVPTTKNPPKHK